MGLLTLCQIKVKSQAKAFERSCQVAWRNGSASVFGADGCAFESRRDRFFFFFFFSFVVILERGSFFSVLLM